LAKHSFISEISESGKPEQDVFQRFFYDLATLILYPFTCQMNREIARIAHQLQSTYAGAAWHGSPVKKVLSGLTAAQAAARPLPQAHTIWELVSHMTAWREFTRRKLLGENDFDIRTPEQDWPATPPVSEENWQQTLAKLEANQQQLVQLLAETQDSLLEEIVPGRKYSFYHLLHGIIQHDLYHLGQIALLKKAIE
jgi:uncharacterized damage-inducible protein DinB